MTAAEGAIRRELLYAGLGFTRLQKHAHAMRAPRIALLDGVPDTADPHFRRVAAHGAGTATDHATAMASLLVAPGAEDECTLLCWPTLAAIDAVAGHLHAACAARPAPDFVLLGFEFAGTAPAFVRAMTAALDVALAAGIPVLAPAGNHGGAIAHPLYAHPALLPVTAAGCAWGPAAARGIAAPGDAIPVVLTGGRRAAASGTSFAAALAGAALAALCARSRLPAMRLCAALALCTGAGARTRTLPPDLDVWRAYRHLSLS